jgi:hypothetical protein
MHESFQIMHGNSDRLISNRAAAYSSGAKQENMVIVSFAALLKTCDAAIMRSLTVVCHQQVAMSTCLRQGHNGSLIVV